MRDAEKPMKIRVFEHNAVRYACYRKVWGPYTVHKQVSSHIDMRGRAAYTPRDKCQVISTCTRRLREIALACMYLMVYGTIPLSAAHGACNAHMWLLWARSCSCRYGLRHIEMQCMSISFTHIEKPFRLCVFCMSISLASYRYAKKSMKIRVICHYTEQCHAVCPLVYLGTGGCEGGR